MTNNFDNTAFYLDQAGLELSLSDFAFDATQANQVQQHLQQQQQQQQLLHQQHQHQQRQQKQQHQQEQQKLQNLLLRDDPSHNSRSENQPNNNNNQQHDANNPAVTTSSGPYDFRPAVMTMEMMNPTGTGSASTTPIFQTHPDKINNTSSNSSNGTRAAASLQQLQQQHQQQQLLLQQQQQRQQQQLRQQQQQQLQQLPQTQAQLQAQAQAQAHAQQAHHQHKDGGATARQNLLKPTGSDYYAAAAADYSQYQYMSPMGIQPDTSVETAMTMPEQFDEEAADSTEQIRPMGFLQGTPMLSPELTPAKPYPNLSQSMSSGDGFTLTSPAIGPHRNSQMDYISFTNGQDFSALPMQFQQAHQIQQQQLQSFQAQQQQQQQQQQQFMSSDAQQQQQQVHQGIGTKHARDAANGQRPGLKRRPTAEHSAANGVGSRIAASTPVTAATVAAAANVTASNVGVGPIRAMSKSSPALGPLTSTPLSQTGVRKPVVSSSTNRTSRPSSLVPAPASPMGMHFSGGNHHITPSPILTSTINGTPQSQSQPSPSPHLVGSMNQLSMMPASPAMFSLPASSMMPPPMTLPQQQTQSHIQTHRQLQISQPVQMQQQQQQYQLSIHSPQQLQQQQHNHFAPIGSMLRPAGSAAPLAAATIASAPIPIAAITTPTMTGSVDTVMSQAQNTASPSLTGTLTPKLALAPVTPASLMKLSGAGSGSESTPTSSPKSASNNNNNTNAALAPVNSSNTGTSSSSSPSATSPATTTTAKSSRSIAAKSTEKSKAPAGGSGSSSRSSSGGSKRSGGGTSKNKVSTNAGVLAPRTPGTTSTTVISPMPAGGFATLISPALKPTLMPQPPHHHRGSLTGQPILVSTARGQSLLVSPSLKPWLPGVSTTEAMARLASKSNYQNILDGDHTALGLSYNTDLHSGIELRRTSHKAAEQKRRDSLKHCFDDLRQMIPNIVDKAPSKVFLLKKSFDYICSLKAEMAQRDLTIARMQAQQEYFQKACQQWFESGAVGGGGVPDMEEWKMPEEMLDQATRRELEVAQMAAEMAEQSAAAVEAARIGNQPGGGGNGGNKDGKKSANGVTSMQATGSATSSSTSQQQRQSASSKDDSDDDEDDDLTPTVSRRSSTAANNMMSSSSSTAPSSTSSSSSSTSTSTPTIHPLSGASPLDIQMTSAFTASSTSSSSTSAAQKQRTRSRSSRSDDEDEDDDEDDEGDDEDDEDYDGDQEMRTVQ